MRGKIAVFAVFCYVRKKFISGRSEKRYELVNLNALSQETFEYRFVRAEDTRETVINITT